MLKKTLFDAFCVHGRIASHVESDPPGIQLVGGPGLEVVSAEYIIAC